MPYLLITLMISIVVAFFAVQNAGPVTVGFLMWTLETSLVVVILGSAFAGALAMGFFTLMIKAKHYLDNRTIKYEIETVKKENAKLREELSALRIQRNDNTQETTTEAKV